MKSETVWPAGAIEPTIHVAIAFHSDRGHVAKLAHNLARGVEVQGALAGLVSLQDQDLDEEGWAALERADAIVFGAPTYMGGPSAVFKRFAEATLPIWARQGWRSKVAAGFTHSQAMSGDKLNTLQHFSILAAQHGMVWVNLDLLPGWCQQQASIDDRNRLGAWLGVISQSNGDGTLDSNPRRGDLGTAAHLGRRVATITHALVLGRRQLQREAGSSPTAQTIDA
jgi:NAD(P)H dehydrogenase (quinone)